MAGVTTTGAAAAGIITIPVAWIPAAIGGVVAGVVLIAGLVHTSFCEDNCRTLYDTATGKSIATSRYRLTAAEVNPSGEQVAYQARVTMENGTELDVRVKREELMSMVWGGASVTVTSSNPNPVFVRLARKPKGSGMYLRTTRNRSTKDNLRSLPPV